MFDLGLLPSFVVTHLWQSVVLAAVLAMILVIGKRMSGAARHGLACAALAASILAPVAAFFPTQSMLVSLLEALDVAPAVSGASATALSPARATQDAPMGSFGPTARVEGMEFGGVGSPEVAGWRLPPMTLPGLDLPGLALPFVLVWAAGAVLMLARVARDLSAVEGMVARATPVQLPTGLASRLGGVRVALSADAPGPMAAGLLRPCIILPSTAVDQFRSAEMTALLEHERAHIERCDVVTALAQRLALALLWWSPASYWISRRIDEEREVACDEAAVARTGDARAFARTLTTQAETQLWARAPRLAVGAIGQRSQFGRRIKRLIELAKSGGVARRYSGRLGFSALALAITAAVFVTPRIVADTPEERAAPPPVDSALDGARNGRDREFGFAFPPEPPLPPVAPHPPSPQGDDLSAIGVELSAMLEEINREIEMSVGEEMPGLKGEMQGLGLELASLGMEIGLLASQEAMRELPTILDQVQADLKAQGIEVEFDGEHLHFDMEDLRDQLNNELGPEFREEMRQAMEEARLEIQASRDELRAGLDDRRAGMDGARAAIAEARAEMAEARASSESDRARFDVRLDGGGPSARSLDRRLMDAAEEGDGESVRELIAEGAGVNRMFPGDGSALIAAARADEADVVRLLLDAGAQPDAASPGDGSALIVAAQHGNLQIVRILLDAGADIDIASPGDGNPLIKAVLHGEEAIVRLLLDRGAEVNTYVPGDETALINAAYAGELHIVRLLVERGAAVNLAYRAQSELRSPLGVAQRRGHDDVAAYLKGRGAETAPKPAN
ncbi:MAG: ankyrin repeat domain-containing protein [Alphaproteobacteria bacterium]|nr:ankyrin repeat domain-containing protein [Alphaproteobacteria bacterium]